MAFDFSDPGADIRWKQLGELLDDFFKESGSAQAELKQIKMTYLAHKQWASAAAGHLQVSKSMRKFVTIDEKLFKEYTAAGGKMSDETRIEEMQKKLSKKSLKSMEKYKETQTSIGTLRQDLELDWMAYSDVSIQVCLDGVAGDSMQ